MTNPESQQTHRSEAALIWRRLCRNRLALASMVFIIVLVGVSLAAPWLAPQDPLKQNYRALLQPVSADHWFGCDQVGRDIFSRIIHGAGITLYIGLVSIIIGLAAGTLLGMLGGYFGGAVDICVVYVTDILLAFPGFLLAILAIAILGPGINSVILACSYSSVPQFIRITRGLVLAEKEKDYVTAAHSIGETHWSIMLRYILPNCVPALIVLLTLRMAIVILIASGLSFLGFGAQPPSPEWGAMLSEGRAYLQTAPHVAFFPGLFISVLVLAFNLLGDGLRDALDPRMKI